MCAGEEYNPHGLFFGAFVPEWLLARPELTQGAKLCFGRLMQLAGAAGHCSPDVSALAADLGVSRRQAANYLRELRRLGLIATWRRGCGLTNSHTFLWHPWASAARLRVSPPDGHAAAHQPESGAHPTACQALSDVHSGAHPDRHPTARQIPADVHSSAHALILRIPLLLSSEEEEGNPESVPADDPRSRAERLFSAHTHLFAGPFVVLTDRTRLGLVGALEDALAGGHVVDTATIEAALADMRAFGRATVDAFATGLLKVIRGRAASPAAAARSEAVRKAGTARKTAECRPVPRTLAGFTPPPEYFRTGRYPAEWQDARHAEILACWGSLFPTEQSREPLQEARP